MKACVVLLVAVLPIIQAACPDKEDDLQTWNPGHSEAHRVTIGYGRKVLLTTSATVHSLEIKDGGKLVIADTSRPIVLRTKHILIGNNGELHIGSPDCPYKGNFTITLYGRGNDTEPEHSYFGRKYIGVGTGGTLEVHGQRKLAWTFLNSTLHPGEDSEDSYRYEKGWGNRGIIIHAIHPKTAEVLYSDRFDTYKSKDESRRLAQYVESVEDGVILSMVVNDEGSNNLEDTARKSLVKLGSQEFHRLGFRHPWSFITVKGNPSLSVEDHAVYQGTKASSEAKSVRVFSTGNAEHFTVTATSQWVQEAEWTDWFDRDDERGSGDWEKLSDLHKAFPERTCNTPLGMQAETQQGVPSNETGEIFYKNDKDYGFVCLNKDQPDGICHNYKVRFLCGKLVRPHAFIAIKKVINSSVLELADDASSWKVGDRLVVASTDYSMLQAEEFTVLPCPSCSASQVKVQGKPTYLHMGQEVNGVDMRAEVGLLTRNILIQGEMEPFCYASEACKFFNFDTFGGHIKIERGFKAVHMHGAELKHMGQQSMGHYPVHFHMNGDVDERGGYHPPTYVKELSIHHTFSRCVTVHSSNGLLVKDVVGYDALGHCFFLEDGPEERNTFDHCLGLLVKAGTLLPSDRDSRMCQGITDGAYPGYIANPRQDCSATSTFWMANPNNNLIDCAAAGSEETGFWFVFHHVPTGPSEGMYSPGRTEHTPMGHFSNNRAHSNYRAGMILDHGVKTTEASARDKRPFLSLIGARYGPHQDADPLKPRVPALVHHLVAYKNQDHGAWLRGGDVWLDDCQFADNGIGLTLASNFPIRGMQIYDGPINVQNCTFRKYVALEGRHTSAFGFRLNNSWQSCPNNNVTDITFEEVPITSRVFFGEPGPWFNQMEMDGDKTTIFHDVDGSVSEYPGAYLVKDDNWLLRHPDCIDVPDWRAAICSGRYAQIYVQTRDPANLNMKIVKDEYPQHPLDLQGALGKRNHYQQFQPVVMLGKSYTMHWDQPAPAEVVIWLINFNSVTEREKVEHAQLPRGYYHWEEDTGLLFVKVRAHGEREDFAFCSTKGCERVKIKALIPKGSGPSNCMAEAYPKYAEMPIVDVPMPKKLPPAELRTTEHFLEVKLESYNTRFFHIKEDYAFTEVNGKKTHLVEDGVLVTVIDGHSGQVLDSQTFRNSILLGIPAQITGFISGLRDESIVLVSSKGRLVSRGPWTKVLELLGADKNVKLKEKLAFVGFKGSFHPEWVRLVTDEESAKIHQVLPLPIVKKRKL
ncbi:hypothetical protein JZ751_019440 [Albula glossodonta]|uniref:hyaluronoglucosaminidase n=1 Tax=Albula glossodonta TaxID=121402 RepID=A0A8T2NNY7_9TELE|nr:hypothetical protein JZ751_019440 [Albula glossodonta]